MTSRDILGRLCDRRRWRAVRVALTFDSLLLLAIQESHGRPARDAIVAVASDDGAWSAMSELAELQLPDAIREGWFSGMDKWLGGEIPPTPEPEVGSDGRLDPRRFAVMRDAVHAEAFLAVSVWPDGGHAATALLDTDEHRAAALEACDVLAYALRSGRLDNAGGRFEWHPSSGDNGDEAA